MRAFWQTEGGPKGGPGGSEADTPDEENDEADVTARTATARRAR